MYHCSSPTSFNLVFSFFEVSFTSEITENFKTFHVSHVGRIVVQKPLKFGIISENLGTYHRHSHLRLEMKEYIAYTG